MWWPFRPPEARPPSKIERKTSKKEKQSRDLQGGRNNNGKQGKHSTVRGLAVSWRSVNRICVNKQHKLRSERVVSDQTSAMLQLYTMKNLVSGISMFMLRNYFYTFLHTKAETLSKLYAFQSL